MSNLQVGEHPVSEWNAQQYQKRKAWLAHSIKKIEEYKRSVKDWERRIEEVKLKPTKGMSVCRAEGYLDDARKKVLTWEQKMRENQWIIAQIQFLYPSQLELLEMMAQEASDEYWAERVVKNTSYGHTLRTAMACDSESGGMGIHKYRKQAQEHDNKTVRLNA